MVLHAHTAAKKKRLPHEFTSSHVSKKNLFLLDYFKLSLLALKVLVLIMLLPIFSHFLAHSLSLLLPLLFLFFSRRFDLAWLQALISSSSEPRVY